VSWTKTRKRTRRSGPGVEFGVNLNNREPLITSDYTLSDLLDLAQLAEQRGFGSVWVGDSLFSKPRYEPLSLLSAISQRTERVLLGTACLVTSTRNPLYLALDWATLDQLSGGRTILGACMGNPEQGVRREFEALGLSFKDRAAIFEEGLAALRSLWTTGTVTQHGEYYNFDDVSFYSGTEMGPLMPVQQPPPTWVVSNIRLTGELSPDVARQRMRNACTRVIKYGDGWMTCCRATHVEEVAEQIAQLRKTAADLGEDFGRYTVSYQVTMNIGDSADQAKGAFGDYISSYYPELSKSVDLSNWGPTGTPETVAEWFRQFHAAGVDHFICRFGALDQFGQVERFASDVLPALEALDAVEPLDALEPPDEKGSAR
jgi:alkanesulfonate monooxygenase SsuD/methylene tetrahydromethanopterin reductase-like flavin-dependent oxidoreductase (luciferase family)